MKINPLGAEIMKLMTAFEIFLMSLKKNNVVWTRDIASI